MKKPILILLSLTLLTFSCKTEKPVEIFSYPDKNEIVAIIKIIITEKKLPLKKDSTDSFHLKLASDLEKIHIYPPDTTKEFVPPKINGFFIEKLLDLKVNGRRFFSSSDSTFFLRQNDTMKLVDLHAELDNDYYLTTSEAEDKIDKKGGESYFSMSVPIFSKDLKKVYIEVNDICYGLCGSGGYFLLEKINNKWTIIDYQALWIS